MIVQSKGIVLHKTRFSEDSVIVKIYTEQCGTVSFIVKNAFSGKSKKKQAYFSPLALLELNFHYKEDNSLHYIKDLSCPRPYLSIPYDMVKNSLLIFYNELLYKLLREAGEDRRLFACIERELLSLEECETPRPDAHILFLLSLAKVIGLCPIDNYTDERCLFSCEDFCFVLPIGRLGEMEKSAGRYLHDLLAASRPESVACPPKSVRDELLQCLLHYFELHNEQVHDIHSVEILAQILGK